MYITAPVFKQFREREAPKIVPAATFFSVYYNLWTD